jgi:hypothetical protein
VERKSLEFHCPRVFLIGKVFLNPTHPEIAAGVEFLSGTGRLLAMLR